MPQGLAVPQGPAVPHGPAVPQGPAVPHGPADIIPSHYPHATSIPPAVPVYQDEQQLVHSLPTYIVL